MTEQTNTPEHLTKLFADCWKDADLKQQFIENPKSVLTDFGMDVPEGVEVNVVENTDNTVHITLPSAPDNYADLSNEELENTAGGVLWATLNFTLQSDPLSMQEEYNYQKNDPINEL